MTSEQDTAEQIALRILDDILADSKRPVDDDELAKLNAEYGFDTSDPFDMLIKNYDLDTEYQQITERWREGGRSDLTEQSAFFESDGCKWQKAFDRYQKSDEWTERLRKRIQQEKDSTASSLEHVGKQVCINKDVSAVRTYMPAKGSTGTIVGGNFEYDPNNPHNSGFMFRVRFELPVMLVDGGQYVNETIVDPDDAKPYMDEHNLPSIVWVRDNEDHVVVYFKEGEFDFVS